MKVKIQDKIYDANEEPIMIIFNNQEEKNLIKDMKENNMKFCMFPDNIKVDKIKEWMKEK